jgi:hypothetical protein
MTFDDRAVVHQRHHIGLRGVARRRGRGKHRPNREGSGVE